MGVPDEERNQMTAFRDQSWNSRYAAMGDAAEAQCAAWLDATDRGYVRYGLDRPPLKMAMLPEFIRHTPDFLTSHSLIECKGFGRDQTAKIKEADLESLKDWNKQHPVEMFFYDQSNARCIVVALADLLKASKDSRITSGVFNDEIPKPYWGYSAELLAEIGTVYDASAQAA
jgi:hypothetical protein